MSKIRNKLLALGNGRRNFLIVVQSLIGLGLIGLGLIGLGLIGLGLILWLAASCSGEVNRPTDIAEMPTGWPYDSTVYKFRYGHRTRTVDDPNNKLQWIYGDLPDTILVSEGKRLIIYDSPGAVLHSENDSVSVQYDSVKYGGYMGIWSEGTTFIVGLEGVVMEYRWHPYPGCYIC